VDECASLLGEKIRSCHIKDIHFKPKYTFQVEECAPGEGEFPIRYYVSKMNDINPDMPMILEHLNSDEEYLKYMGYLKEELHGLY
jgi:sugar phosphate isomerase/epimerase